MPRRVAALAFLCVLSAAPAAVALEPARISVSLNSDGTGTMVVNSQTNPAGEGWSWQVCPAGGACAPFASGRIVGTGSASPGTTFNAASTLGATATSPEWHGKVSPSTRPVVSGFLRANALITPVPGTWNGGWDGDRDITELAACARADGRDCVTLTHQHYVSSCPYGSAVIDRMFTGRYLRVAAERHGRDEALATYAVGSPYSTKVMKAGPATAVAIAGRIAAARGPRESDCGPPPLVCQSTAARAACKTAPVARLSAAGSASVICLTACRLALVAEHGRRDARVTRAIHAAGSASLRLSRKALRGLGAARVRLRLLVDNEERARRVVAAGS